MTFTRQLIDSYFIKSGSWFKFFKFFLPTKLQDLNEFCCFFPDKGSKDSQAKKEALVHSKHENCLATAQEHFVLFWASFVWDSHSWRINQPSGHVITTCYLSLSNPPFPMCTHSCEIDAFCHISVVHWRNINTPFWGTFSTLFPSISNGANSLFTPRLHCILFHWWPV